MGTAGDATETTEEKVTNVALVAQRESSRLLSGWLQVRILPGALVMRGASDALVAQWQSTRLLSGCVQVQVLPGALSGVRKERARFEMERLISLFREPDYESPLDDESEQRSPQADEEPAYFRQLLEYLRQRKENASEPSDELIGV